MPIITVKLKPGRTDAQKAAFESVVRAAAIRDLAAAPDTVAIDYVEA